MEYCRRPAQSHAYADQSSYQWIAKQASTDCRVDRRELRLLSNGNHWQVRYSFFFNLNNLSLLFNWDFLIFFKSIESSSNKTELASFLSQLVSKAELFSYATSRTSWAWAWRWKMTRHSSTILICSHLISFVFSLKSSFCSMNFKIAFI
jgi:hypothetical protein